MVPRMAEKNPERSCLFRRKNRDAAGRPVYRATGRAVWRSVASFPEDRLEIRPTPRAELATSSSDGSHTGAVSSTEITAPTPRRSTDSPERLGAAQKNWSRPIPRMRKSTTM